MTSTEESVELSENDPTLAGPSLSKSKRQKKLTSAVWKDFERLPLGEDKKLRAKCKQCGNEYLADSKFGTGNLRRHIETCIKRDTRDIGQMFMTRAEGLISMRSSKIDQENFRELVTTTIIKHDLPFQFVEYDGIRNLFSYLNEDIKQISRNTAKADVVKMHKREKGRLQNLLQSIPGRISLTSDLWTSIATDGYICLTTHFVDQNWVLQKRILNFCIMPPPHTGICLAEKVHTLLNDWDIDRKLISITLDNASANDVFAGLLNSQLRLKNALLVDGEFFHVRCCAYIINLIVQDGLKEVDEAVIKIRESIKYLKGSQSRKTKFFECVSQVALDNKKGLRQDVPTRWNSTYIMLESAFGYRRAFCHLELVDSNYKHFPSQEEWNRVEKIVKFLELFYRVTCTFSGSQYPTSCVYFREVWMIQLTLKGEMQSSDSYIRRMATQMYGKFDKYWSEYSIILAMAVIFDPRYKFQFVEFCYTKLYGSSSFESMRVREKLLLLFNEYMHKSLEVSTNPSDTTNIIGMNSIDQDTNDDNAFYNMKEFDSFESQVVTSAQKSQLELYLDEPRLDRTTKVEVLEYWKSNQFRYPEFSLMARDLLSIPISTVASESAFSCGGRVLDQFRSALKPENVEALVCTRDWLYGSKDNFVPDIDELTGDIMTSKEDSLSAASAQSSNHINI